MLELLGAAALLCLLALIATASVAAIESRSRMRRVRRLAEERRTDTKGAFVLAMQRAGVPPAVSAALQDELSRTLELYGIRSFSAQPDDRLALIYGATLPDAENEFCDPDLREIVGTVARKTGRTVPIAGQALDAELGKLDTVAELAQWIAALPTA